LCQKRTLKWRTEDAPLHQLGRHNGRTLRAGDFVNYATLGYGDVLPVERWRLLGRDERQRHRESSARVQSEEIEAIASLVVTTALA